MAFQKIEELLIAASTDPAVQRAFHASEGAAFPGLGAPAREALLSGDSQRIHFAIVDGQGAGQAGADEPRLRAIPPASMAAEEAGPRDRVRPIPQASMASKAFGDWPVTTP
jgi:hypothetical protein